MLVVPLMVLTRLVEATLRGFHHLVIGQLPEYAIKPVMMIAAFVAIIIFAPSLLTASNGIAVGIGATGAGLAVGFAILRSRIPSSVREAVPRHEFSVWIKSALPLFLIGSMRIINNETDVIMLGTLQGTDAAGIFRIAGRGADLIAFVLTAFKLPWLRQSPDCTLEGRLRAFNESSRGQRRSSCCSQPRPPSCLRPSADGSWAYSARSSSPGRPPSSF